MAKIVIIGAGFAGHTAAVYLGKILGDNHEVTVINKFKYFLYLPSLIWMGVDRMHPQKVQFSLKPIYDKCNVNFVHGKATEVHPDDNYVVAQKNGESDSTRIDYDYLIISTGPNLDFEATPGLGPSKGNTYSVCTLDHTVKCRNAYLECRERMKRGEKVKMVIGTGHAGSTCQGAALEYIMNIHSDLIRHNLRDKAELLWISNEPAFGDFGVGGLRFTKGPIASSEEAMRDFFIKYEMKTEIQKGVKEVNDKSIYWENYEGNYGETSYDFAMLIPRFTGSILEYFDKNGENITAKMVNPTNFVLVDGYYGLDYDSLQYTPEAWPATYQNPNYRNIFAAGISFAPPGPISVPHTTPNGTSIVATPPRTGMAAGIIGRMVALNIISLVRDGKMKYQERMTEMYGACIASADPSLTSGHAISILLFPVVPNYIRYPETYGRDPFITRLEDGLAGAWIKRIVHTTMYYKANAFPGWQFIPE